MISARERRAESSPRCALGYEELGTVGRPQNASPGGSPALTHPTEKGARHTTDEHAAAGEPRQRDGDAAGKLCPRPRLQRSSVRKQHTGRAADQHIPIPHVPSQGVTAVSEPTSQGSAVPREASSISSAFLFWPSKAKSKACSFVRIRSSDTQRETYQLHSARSFLKGRSSI